MPMILGHMGAGDNGADVNPSQSESLDMPDIAESSRCKILGETKLDRGANAGKR